jgi:hypothetical protein
MPTPTKSARGRSAEASAIASRQEPASERAARHLRRYLTGALGPVSHLKRPNGMDRPRRKRRRRPADLDRVGILAFNTDTPAVRIP